MSSSSLALLSGLQLQAHAAEPYFVQLRRQIEALVRSGALPAGTCMPSERELAEKLQIGRSIVRRCYILLRNAQLLYSQTSRYGTIVRGVPSQSDPTGGFAGQAQEPPPELPCHSRAGGNFAGMTPLFPPPHQGEGCPVFPPPLQGEGRGGDGFLPPLPACGAREQTPKFNS